ncbi:SGNH/GDSL hydrolase family protein [Mucilaginibacter ginsenosidivorax]|uniref:SGNH/GDSL hydrolase family protein n=1 Tax=Mucilaginibacter ginsenosidivorax TaxID=862126 RepID=A0A5B8W8T2_9SPHI|nr:SGNH/GDSL hydrolase family protein [Mucilaginibacter ginsenosidivorax]QEC79969.1 SGNH/GDSL hydrolase family protein [Mucilaginibacter ginsenosidivorax]
MKKTRLMLLLAVVLLLLSAYKPQEQTWVAIGDSITYLNDHLDETGSRVTKGYLTRVAEQFPGLHYINKGFNGWTSGGIAQHIDSLGIPAADIYSVFLGTNDWWQGRRTGSLDDYKTGKDNATVYGSFRIIINKLRRLNPTARIVLITPMQRADFVYINDPRNNAFGSYRQKNGQALETIVNAIDSIGRYEQIPVIDLYHDGQLAMDKLVKFKRLKDPASGAYVNYTYPEFTKIPFNPATDDYPYPREAISLTYDGLHPSDQGNAVIAGEVVKVFNPLLNAEDWKKYIDLRAYTKPFWKTDTVIDESVQVIRDQGSLNAKLLFRPAKILSVRAADYSREYIKGKDWDESNGELVILKGSSVPFFCREDLIFKEAKPGHSMNGMMPGTFVLFSEGSYFSSRQLVVSYLPEKLRHWRGPVPELARLTLSNTVSKLKKQTGLKVVFYGNSIEVGYNASGLEKTPPYMPVWPELVINRLKAVYGSQITFVNSSVAGRLAKWGQDSVRQRVMSEKPDLVVIGFGMNDGTAHVAPGTYREQIKAIIDSVRSANTKAEFILIAPMLANPASAFNGFQSLYKTELDKLAGQGIVVADLTGVHRELLKHKTYQDMTGNNVNHPNDYLARWYAQYLLGLLTR